MHLLLGSLALGIVGLDPLGALIAIAALANGVRTRAIVAFAVSILLVTTVMGSGLSLLARANRGTVNWHHYGLGPRNWAALQLIIGFGLIIWGVWRVIRPPLMVDAAKHRRGNNATAMALTGAIFSLGALPDPGFLANVALGAKEPGLPLLIASNALWITMSQMPLTILTVAIIMGKHERLAAWLVRFWSSFKPWLSKAITWGAIVVGTLLVLRFAIWSITGTFIPPFIK